MNVSLLGKKVFAEGNSFIGDRSLWMKVGPKPSDWHLYIRRPLEDTEISRRGLVMDRGRDRTDTATSHGIPGDPRNWKKQAGASPRAFRGSMDLLDWERVNFCHFKLPAWKQFLAVVLGDSYREINRVVGKIRVLTATPPVDTTFLFPSYSRRARRCCGLFCKGNSPPSLAAGMWTEAGRPAPVLLSGMPACLP